MKGELTVAQLAARYSIPARSHDILGGAAVKQDFPMTPLSPGLYQQMASPPCDTPFQSRSAESDKTWQQINGSRRIWDFSLQANTGAPVPSQGHFRIC